MGCRDLDQGKLDEAEPLMRRVLAGSEAKLGADHPRTLPSVRLVAGGRRARAGGCQLGAADAGPTKANVTRAMPTKGFMILSTVL